ncbi:RICIN domain-containing protein [Kitasatospora nipponensis]|uniref:RICIN domain-containing protein n=1 Tax=Kitasatospora nipponensis TaxID=258049 RepID=UPI0031D9F5E5
MSVLSVLGTGTAAHATVNPHHQIHNRYAGFCLDAANYGPQKPSNNGDKVQVWPCNSYDQQGWTYVHVAGWPDNVVTIHNDAAPGSCLDLDVSHSGPNYDFGGNNVQMWQCNGWGNQMWEVNNNGLLINLVNTNRNAPTPVLDAQNFGGTNPGVAGDQVLAWNDWNYGGSQIWSWS